MPYFAVSKVESDQISVIEQVSISLNRSFSDTVTISDVFESGQNPAEGDDASISDSGSLHSQGYCDVTYFLEDYVGISRTF